MASFISLKTPVPRGRGATLNPAGRFETQTREPDPDDGEEDYAGFSCGGVQRQTRVHKDATRTIVSTNDSPDVGMEATVNPYRGCEHGCIYCFARPTHEYLGMSAGTDFETDIFAKENAAALLADKLSSRGWQPKIITLSGVTDPYQPVERRLGITRACFQVLHDFHNPAAVITKSALVVRDSDIFSAMASWNGILVNMSVTTLDPHLSRLMEPRAAQPHLRLRAIEKLAARNIPVSVIIGPVLPGLTDHEIPKILKAAAEAGASGAHYTMLRLPYGVKDLFQHWLQEHFPDRAGRVLNRIRSVRDGRLNDPDFTTRMTGNGAFAQNVAGLFNLYKNKYKLMRHFHDLSTAHFNRNARAAQGDLFS